MSDRKVNITGPEIARRLSVLQGKALSQVIYHDGQDDDGKPYFEYDSSSDRHELMWGVDLVVADGTCVGLTWDMNGRLGEYGLFVQPGGNAKLLVTGTPQIDQTENPHWSPFIGKIITKFTVSKLANLLGKDPYCDCRIDFEDGSCLWICARSGSQECKENGDDCIVVFTESEAIRLGIRLNES